MASRTLFSMTHFYLILIISFDQSFHQKDLKIYIKSVIFVFVHICECFLSFFKADAYIWLTHVVMLLSREINHFRCFLPVLNDLSVFLLQAWNKYSPLPPSRGQNGKKPLSLPQQLEKTPERVVRPGRSRAAENLPADSQDPYSSLSIEAQAFVNNLTGMGFPRSRASRAVLKLGQDDKLVCTLSHL